VLEVPVSQFQLGELYRLHCALSIEELWLRCFELGAMFTELQLEGFLCAALRATAHEHNLLALALNQYFGDIGVRKLVPYIESGLDV
jgi:hypothetical protein